MSQLYAIKIYLFEAYYVLETVGYKKTSNIWDCLGRAGSLIPLRETAIHIKLTSQWAKFYGSCKIKVLFKHKGSDQLHPTVQIVNQ